MFLQNLRKEKKETQQETADAIGISRSGYTLIENGNRTPSLGIVCRLAEHWNITIDKIVKAIQEKHDSSLFLLPPQTKGLLPPTGGVFLPLPLPPSSERRCKGNGESENRRWMDEH